MATQNVTTHNVTTHVVVIINAIYVHLNLIELWVEKVGLGSNLNFTIITRLYLCSVISCVETLQAGLI